MAPRIFTVALAVALLVAGGNIVRGQNFGGGNSAFGSGMGGGGFGSSMGGGGFGSSSFGSSGLGGSGGFGSSGFGSSGFGGGGGSGGFGSSGFGNNAFGNSGMGNQGMGANGQGGQAFIGRDSADMQGTFGQTNRNGNQSMQSMNRTAGGGNNQSRNRNRRNQNNNQKQQASSKNAKPPVTVRLQMAFTRPVVAPNLTGDNIGLKLRKILADHGITQPNVSLDGDGIVVLQGAAVSESERLVLEKLTALQPGVREVQNLMTVAQAPTELTPPGIGN